MSRIAYLGACDWRHPEWLDAFYPSDLPEDWRWAYYVTQFSCVWLDAERWQALDGETLAEMTRECPPGFEILLEDNGAGSPHLDRLLAAANGRARATRREDACILRFDAGTDLARLSGRLIEAAARPPVYVLSEDADLAMLERVSTLLELLAI